MSDEERLEHLESTLENASPEPWYTMGDTETEVRLITADSIHLYTDQNVEQATFDAFFCQAARADVPWLIAEYRRLRAENANLKRLLDDANERAAQIEDWQVKCALLEVDRDKARGENAALAGERDRLREALQRLERCFQGDWPTIEIALRSNENAPHWLRGPVDDETRDAVVQARKCLGRMDTKEEV